MPSISWILDKTCDNCGAEVHYESQLGEKFKLSEASAERKLYRRAQEWINEFPIGAPVPWPNDLDPYIVDNTRNNLFSSIDVINRMSRPKFQVIENPQFYYIKCPVCNKRIYVC